MSRLDKLFGGQPGAAEKARSSMHKTYGRQNGETIFQATVFKRERKAKRKTAQTSRRRNRAGG